MKCIIHVLVASIAVSAVLACSSEDSSSGSAGTGGETQGEGGAAGDDGTGGSAEAGSAGVGGQEQGGAAGSTGGAAGSTGGSAGSSGPPTCDNLATKALADLVLAEKKVICACAAQSVGGYNEWVKCGTSGEVCIFEEESDCLNKAPKCTATVAEFLACWEAQGKDVCADIFDLPECQSYLNACF